MAYPDYIRQKARQMRSERRMTLDEIAERLAISKSTVWYWIRDIEVVPPGKSLQTPARRAVQARATKARSSAAAEKRSAWYEQGQAEYESLCALPTFSDFVAMYIGEGTRSDRNCVALANSNPAVVGLAATWINRFAANPVGYSFHYHADQAPAKLRAYWAAALHIEPDAIKAYAKSNSGALSGRTRRYVWGVLTVRVGDTALRARLQAWMDAMQANWGIHSDVRGV